MLDYVCKGIEIARYRASTQAYHYRLVEVRQLYGEWKAKNITARDFMRKMDLTANTFYRRVREYESKNGITDTS